MNYQQFYTQRMKKNILTLIIAVLLIIGVFLTAGAQPPPQKPDTKIYYVPFTFQMYQQMQIQASHADSVLLQSEAKVKDASPALMFIDQLRSVFQQAYLRKDTLVTTPLKPDNKKK